MGFFKGVKDNFKKSEAAVVVEKLLEQQAKMGMFDLAPGKTANQLVEAFWTSARQILDGNRGQRPHKITFAAGALADAIEKLEQRNPNRAVFLMCLGTVLEELEANGTLYPLSNLDHHLVDAATQVFIAASQNLAESPLGQEIDALLGQPQVPWEEWYQAYKEEAGRVNSSLEVGDDGLSLVDIMDDEPLRRAHKDGVDPVSLARRFADQFDILNFG